MKRLVKIMVSGVIASSLLLGSVSVFAQGESDKNLIFDKQGYSIRYKDGSIIQRNSLTFGDVGVEVFDENGNSLGKVNLTKNDTNSPYLDFPQEKLQGTVVKAPILPVYQGTTETTTEETTETTTQKPISQQSSNVSSQRVIKVTIGSKIGNVNGQDVEMDVAPYIRNGVTMIPLRFVATALGIPNENIVFNQGSKSVTIKYSKDMDIHFLPYEIQIKNSRTFVPFRMLGQYLNLEIGWDSNTKTATMKGNVAPSTDIITENKPSQNNQNNVSNEQKELTEQEIRAMEEEVVRLVNEERAKYGLEPLQIDETLMQSARAKSEDMANRDYYDHTDPNGYNMARDLNVAENLGAKSTSKASVESWLNSQGHRANILNPNYKYIGVGLAYGKATWFYNDNEEHPYWTQHFK